MNKFEQAVRKMPVSLSSQEYYTQMAATMPKKKWFAPTNANGSRAYDICSELFHAGLIARKTVPIISKLGHRQGSTRYFYIAEDMDFSEA